MKLASISDKNAEAAFLYCLLQDSDLFTSVSDVKPEHFSGERHRVLFEAMIACSASEHTFNIPTFVRFMIEAGFLARLSPPTEEAFLKIELAGMDPGFRGAKHLRTYANVILRCARNKAVARLIDESKEAAELGRFDEVPALARAIEKASQNGHSDLASESLELIYATDPPVTPWIMKNLLAESDIAIISAPGGTGKTYLMYALGLSLASGLPIWGHWAPPRAYNVLLVDLEGAAWERKQRLHKVGRGLGLLGGEVPLPVPAGFRVATRKVNVDSPESVEHLRTEIQRHRIEILLLDSFRRLSSRNLNNAEVCSDIFTRVFQPIRDEFGCLTAISDHTRKLAGDPTLDDPSQRTIGSVDKTNMVDALFVVSERKEGGISIIPIKTRHSERSDPFALEMTIDEDEARFTYIGGLDKVASSIRDAIVVLIQSRGGEVSRGTILGLLPEFTHRGIDKALGLLVEDGILWKRRAGHEVYYRLRG